MEFLEHLGDYDDVPYDGLMDLMATHHPKMLPEGRIVPGEGSLTHQAPRPDHRPDAGMQLRPG